MSSAPLACISICNKYRHALVVFGGVKGLEAAVEADDKLEASDPKELFDSYLNTCPVQGSGTIRTEVMECALPSCLT